MTTATAPRPAALTRTAPSLRAEALALRLEQGAAALVAFARDLTEAEWNTRIPKDGRKVGVVVHHVGSMYPVEMQFVQMLAAGKPIIGVTWADIAEVNATHAHEFDGVTKAAAIELVKRNSAAAAAAVRALSDDELDRAAPVSLNANAPLTCQFFIEDHPLRHSFHHLEKIRGAVRYTVLAA